jgi:glucosyl-3-phosphoglycerate synthase
MSDFAQTGLICTLQRLNETHGPSIEAAVVAHSRERPITLVLPCHARDLTEPALAHILDEISGAKFLREVIVSMNGRDPAGFARAREIFARLPQPHCILWNDGPTLEPLLGRILSEPDGRIPHGKGLNVWAACGLVVARAKSEIIVTQDCDVSSFRRENLARLCFAAVHPALRYEFSKMYYSRVSDRLYGRVSRLFLAPLLHALIRTAGHQPLIDFLQSFRYPLAGECALSRQLAGALPMSAGWGFEIGMLCETFRRTDPRHVAQVDGGPHYDHRHQPLGDETGGLFRMSREIAGTLIAHLREEGLPVSSAQFSAALRASFARESDEALRRFRHLSLINGLADGGDEEEAAAHFSRALAEAGETASASELPAWNHVAAAHPALVAEFATAAIGS